MPLLFLLLVLQLPAGATHARTLYVENSGTATCSDRTSYAANSASAPWCTIGRAAWGSGDPNRPMASQAAAAGDTVRIASGMYTTESRHTSCASGARFAVALNPANSGTSESLITFQGTGTVHVRLAPGYVGPTIGADGRDHIVWDNVRIDETAAQGVSCADTGPVVIHASTGSRILNSTIRGTYRAWSDNYSGVRLEATNRTVVANNAIHDFRGNWGHNDAAIMTYDAANSVIEHNHIHGCQTGIFLKGDHAGDGWPQENNVVRLNRIEDCTAKSLFMIAGNGSRIYQNIIKNGNPGFRHDGSKTSDLAVVNNTFIVDNGTGIAAYSISPVAPTVVDFRFLNNIVYGTWGEAINIGDAPEIGGQAFEHNVYYGFRKFGSLNGSLISLTTWKNTHNRDNVAPASINADPLFVDTSFFKLKAGSPARKVGIDVLDLDGDGNTGNSIPAGAYVTGTEIIGVTTGRISIPPGSRGPR
jgi:hypothetical protein